MGGGVWPFLVGGVICLVNCVNERDLLGYLGFRFRFQVFRVQVSVCKVLGLGFQGFGLGFQGFGLGFQGFGLGFQGFCLGSQGFGLGFQGFGLGWVPGGVWSQGSNVKELTEGHHKDWRLRLTLTQHGETYQVQTQLGLTD